MAIKVLAFTDHHTATGEINGDFATYTCPLCPGWSRTLNLVTGKITTTEKGKYFLIGHSGQVSQLPEMFSLNIKAVDALPPGISGRNSFSTN